MGFIREIGSAFIRLTVRREGVKADLEATKREVASATQSMQRDADRASAGMFSSLKGFRKGLNDTLGVVISLITRFTSIVALIGAAGFGAKKLYDYLTDASKATSELHGTLTDIRQSLDAMSNRQAAKGDPLGMAAQKAAIDEAKAAYDKLQKAADEALKSAIEEEKRFRSRSTPAAIEGIRQAADLSVLVNRESQEAILAINRDFEERRRRIQEENAARQGEGLVEAFREAQNEIGKGLAPLEGPEMESQLHFAKIAKEIREDAVRDEVRLYEQLMREAETRLAEFRRLQGGSFSGDIRTTNALLHQILNSI